MRTRIRSQVHANIVKKSVLTMPYLFRGLIVAGLSLLVLPGQTWGQTPNLDLTQVAIEDLMKIEVTSVSRKEQKITKTASAVFVINADDILRSGATNVPDLLRMVPGLNVAQINASNWAISVRGFNGQYSNKLLVLVDGRTVYTPMFAGVFWDAQGVPLDSIERIEVIRGPGATVWGANAVNGVINIMTKKAQETLGGLLTAGGGTHEWGFGTARYGGRIGSHTAYRVTVDGLDNAPFRDTSGQTARDQWRVIHGGFRGDASVSPRDAITVQGDVYRGTAGGVASSVVSISPPLNAALTVRDRSSGWDLLSRWDHVVSSNSETSLQLYFDRGTRGEARYGIGVNTFDLDFHHHAGWGSRQDFVWGLGYRLSSDTTRIQKQISFTPASSSLHLFSLFVQDEIALRPSRIYLTLGTKVEHQDYDGFSLQPSARITWAAGERHMFWAAVSQAQKTPSRADRGIRVNFAAFPGPNNLPLLVSLLGNPQQKAERLKAAEAGYRTKLAENLSLDSTLFFNDYSRLVSIEPGNVRPETDPPPVHLVLPSFFANLLYGEAHGAELFANWKVGRHWNLSPGYSFFTMHLHPSQEGHDLATGPLTEGSIPHHQAQLRSSVSLPHHWQWNASAYFVGRLPALAVPSYTRVDTNLTWEAFEGVSVSLAGENLLRDRHTEFTGPNSSVQSSLIKRSAYAKCTWRF